MPAMRFLVRSAKRRLFIGLYPFTVLCAAPIALMLFLVYSGIADNLFGIQDMAHNVRTEYLPSILRAQRALSDISTLRRHAEHIMDMDDPVMRRRNRIMAHAIANRGMFSDDPEIARNGQELARRIRELAELRNRADHAHDNLHVAAFRLTEAVSDLSRFLSRAEGEEMRRLLYVDPARKMDRNSFRPLVENRFEQFLPLFRLCAGSATAAAFAPETMTGADETPVDTAPAPLCGNFLAGMRKMQTAWTEREQTDAAAKILWSRLDVLLSKTSDMAGKAATGKIERTMKKISLDAERIEHFFHSAFIFLILLVCFLLFMLHVHLLSPIAAAVTQIRKIRNGTCKERENNREQPAFSIRIRELAELLSLLPELRRHMAALDARSSSLEREKAHYAALSLRDGLTGAFNRRCLDQRLAGEGETTPLAALMVDVDFFKHYNDTYGHQAGDACLVRLVRELESAVRSTDGVYRYGGEEFVVLLPGASMKDAALLAEILVKRVRNMGIAHSASGVNNVVTVSIGVAARGPESPLSGEALLKHADEALYRAKAEGRNRVALQPVSQTVPA